MTFDFDKLVADTFGDREPIVPYDIQKDYDHLEELRKKALEDGIKLEKELSEFYGLFVQGEKEVVDDPEPVIGRLFKPEPHVVEL